MSDSTGRNKSQSPSASTILHKGGACLNCRRRKIRCDGRRPLCGPCSSSDAFRDCEYTDVGTTRTQALEAQISVLQKRIADLEQSAHSSSSSSSEPYSDSVVLSSLPYRGTLMGHLSPSVLESALHTFISQCPDLGFFLNISRFRESALSFESGTERPSPALLSAAHLWGIHLSGELTAQGIMNHHSQAVLQCIQANVLLAQYFFRNQRILEGRYHANAAMSLVISTRLHTIRSSDPPRVDSILGVPGELSDPKDEIEEGERINGFWTVLALNNCWTAADGTPSNLSYSTPGGRIDVPWPLEMFEYSQNPLPAGYTTTHTVQNFLGRQPDNGNSTLALYAKASILLDQASRIGYKFRPGMAQQEASQFFASFTSLEQVISGFISSLPPIDVSNSRTSRSTVLLVHSIAHASMIRLHAPFLTRNPSSRGRVVTSTRAIVRTLQTLDVANIGFIDAIMGIIWAMVSQVLIHEIASAAGGANNEPQQLLNVIMTAMGQAHCPFIDAQLILVRRLYSDTIH